MLKIGQIDFINTLPLDLDGPIEGLSIEKVKAPPTTINYMLLEGQVDLGVISASFYLEHQRDLARLGNFGIISDGPAMSVLLFSKKELAGLETGKTLKIYETPKSATSILLNRILLSHFRKVSFQSELIRANADAVLLIGDDALIERKTKRWKYVYDLGEEWKKYTGLPAVFALLTTNKRIYQNKKAELDLYLLCLKQSYERKMRHLEEIVQTAKEKTGLDEVTLRRYFRSLKYELGTREEKTLQLFAHLAAVYEIPIEELV